MKIKLMYSLFCLTLCFFLIRCDDEEFASITGKWNGDKAQFKVNLIPVTEEDLNVALEFDANDKVTYSEGANTITGTYKISGKTLTISGITVSSFPIDFSGDYKIKDLTETKLVLEAERDGEFTHPDYGNVSGKVLVTLHFNR